jgi:hypothetical protein
MPSQSKSNIEQIGGTENTVPKIVKNVKIFTPNPERQ